MIKKDGKEYHAWCPQLPGCHTHGKTIDEALEHLKEAMELYIEDLLDETAMNAKKQYLVSLN